MRSLVVICLSVFVCLVVGVEVEAQSNPFIGIWELNLERSTFDPGPGPRSAVQSYSEGPGGFILFTRSSVNADGSPGFAQVAFKLDGESYSVNQSGTLARTLRVPNQPEPARMFNSRGANTYESLPLGGGGTIFTTTVSPDGQTLTRTSRGVDQTFTNVEVYDRVD